MNYETDRSREDKLTLLEGDCIEVMASLEPASVDAIVTDPPYGIGFMGHEWDQPGAARAERRKEAAPNFRERTGDHAKTRERSPSMHAGEYDLSLTVNRRYQGWCEAWAREAFRVLKPGGHLLASCGTRTYHRLASGVEDAGFEIRDSIMWLYGSGFPKSLDVSKAIDKAAGAEREVVGESRHSRNRSAPSWQAADEAPHGMVGNPEGVRALTAPATPEAAQWEGWGTALKPSYEPIVVARKPLIGTVAENVLEHGTGGLNIDACRIEGAAPHHYHAGRPSGSGSFVGAGNPTTEKFSGRFPANVVLSHTEDCVPVGMRKVRGSGSVTGEEPSSKTDTVLGDFAGREPFETYADPDGTETIEAWECAPGCPVATLDAQSGDRPGFSSGGVRKREGDRVAIGGGLHGNGDRSQLYSDSGGASRFFYCAKTSRAERNAGLEGFEEVDAGNFEDDSYEWKTDGRGNPRKAPIRKANHHPTVKPINLMRWLCRLVTPPEGTILDPFLGSGTTGCAAALEGFDFIGIEREAEYCRIAEARCRFWARHIGRDVKQVLDAERRRQRSKRRRPRRSRDEDGSS